jgi:hypothetical protein
MGFAISLAVVYVVVIYLVFFKFKWLKFSIVWGIVSFWIGFHLLLVFVIGMRFYAPYTIDGHIVRNTIQRCTTGTRSSSSACASRSRSSSACRA